MNCTHDEKIKRVLKRTFLGEDFTYDGEVCKRCESSLWDESSERAFKKWLTELHKKKRHLFQIQYSITKEVQKCLERLNESFFEIEESVLVRAIVIVYLKMVAGNDKGFDQGDVYSSFKKESEKVHKKIQFRPPGMRDIISIRDMLGVRSSFIVEEALLRILALSIESNEEMNAYWRSIVFKEIETILKAA